MSGPAEPPGFRSEQGVPPRGSEPVQPARGFDWNNGFDSVRIGLVGPTDSGKSTFLGAALLGTLRGKARPGWSVVPWDQEAQTFARKTLDSLEFRREFPSPTARPPAPMTLQVAQDTRVRAQAVRRLLLPPRMRTHRDLPFELMVQLQDMPGEIYDRDARSFDAQREAAIRHLLGADGFIYIYDPTRDADDQATQAAKSFIDTLMLMREYSRTRRLPQYVAVCVAKLDEQAVFERARDRHYVSVNPDRDHFGRMTPDNAAQFFEWLCDQNRERSGDLIRGALRDYFRAERLRYYATSAIGFYSQDGKVDPDLYMNAHPSGPGETDRMTIRGPVQPVNVLEPLIDLAQDVWLSKLRRAGSTRWSEE